METTEQLLSKIVAVYYHAESRTLVIRYPNEQYECARGEYAESLFRALQDDGFVFSGFWHARINDNDAEPTSFYAYIRMSNLGLG